MIYSSTDNLHVGTDKYDWITAVFEKQTWAELEKKSNSSDAKISTVFSFLFYS